MKLPAGLKVFERGWLSANNILFEGSAGAALVDTGYVSHAEQTLALVERALEGRPLSRIINTHLHSDHCGGNAALQTRYDLSVIIPAADAPAVRDWNENKLSFRATGQRCPRFGFDATLQGGEVLRLGDADWNVLVAPGHDPHALMLWCPSEGVLISGDALWEDGFGVIFPELDGEPGFEETAATLSLIASLQPRVVIPGHGSPFSDVPAALARARSRLDYLSADPVRNAENGLRVLVKFRLLEQREVALTELPQWMEQVPLMKAANDRWLQLSSQELAERVVQRLLKAGAARIAGGMLIDC